MTLIKQGRAEQSSMSFSRGFNPLYIPQNGKLHVHTWGLIGRLSAVGQNTLTTRKQKKGGARRLFFCIL